MVDCDSFPNCLFTTGQLTLHPMVVIYIETLQSSRMYVVIYSVRCSARHEEVKPSS